MLLSEIIYILLLYGGGIVFFVFMCVFAYSRFTQRVTLPTNKFENESIPPAEVVQKIYYNSSLYETKREEEMIYEANERRLAEIQYRENIIRATARYTVVNQQNPIRFRNASFYF